MKNAFLVISAVLFISCTSIGESSTLNTQDLVNEFTALSEEYTSLEQYDKALELLLMAKSYTTDENSTLLYNIARTAALSENWAVSLDSFNTLLKNDQENLLLKKSIAWTTAQSGDIATAADLYSKLYQEHNYDKEINTNYILVLIANNEKEKAKSVLDDFATLYPDEESLLSLKEKIEEE